MLGTSDLVSDWTGPVCLSLSLICPAGLPHSGLPDGPGPVPPGHPDLPPHHRQLWLGCQRPGLSLEGEAETMGVFLIMLDPS